MRQHHPLNFLGKIRVVPNIPKRLAGLKDLSKNVWWTWNPLARALFRAVHLPTWITVNGNPVDFLRRVRQPDLDAAAKDKEVLKLYDRVMEMFNEYITSKNTWFSKNQEKGVDVLIGYFSAEFGLHHTLPNYSGGLGILAGDHVKSAANLGIPLISVGLLYRDGYFYQSIDEEGAQEAHYHALDFDVLPISLAKDAKGAPVKVGVELAGRTVYVRAWEVTIGRNILLLLDADVPDNSVEDRRITARLYGGDTETRIQQEILLGIGGVRVLRALGKQPTVFHMNEGHSVFLGLERLRELVQEHHLNFAEALELIRGTSLFTTHTPVAAGNDVFSIDLIDKYFSRYYSALGISRTDFLELGLDRTGDNREVYSLTALGLRLCSMANGVSEIHGQVARKMWAHLYRDVPAAETPIDHITNGVHTLSWMSFEMQELVDRYFPAGWRARVMDPELWENFDKVPDAELWDVIKTLKHELVLFIHRVLRKQHQRFGETPDKLREVEDVFTENALTIGFARRFATYKRATLIFRDTARLARILNNPERPVQIVFAGKAHPADKQGQDFIRQIQAYARQPEFKNKIVFIENYDINVCRRLSSGVDVWLNNPRPPLEASGTSGMKVPLNGGLNVSVLDGWWAEAYRANPQSGFAIGDETIYESSEMQDAVDAESIYRILENEVVPAFFERDKKGIPTRWLAHARASLKLIAPLYSTDRMVADYFQKFYSQGSRRLVELGGHKFDRAKKLADWKMGMRINWPMVRARGTACSVTGRTVHVREPIEVTAEVELGRISPDEVSVEIYVESLHHGNGLPEVVRIPMALLNMDDATRTFTYKGQLEEIDTGEFGYTVRVLPKHRDLTNACEMGLVRWG
jgi:starch phosphorylase